MTILDNQNQINKLDPKSVCKSIEFLSKQIKQSWDETQKIKIPNNYKNFTNIVLNGMGGSGLPGHLIQSLFFDELKIPINVINSYKIPKSVNKNTLYIVCSYSGNTEEPLSTIPQAQKVRAKILAITSGGQLEKTMQAQKIPGYKFNDEFNPCQEPRMGLGYPLTSLLGFLNKLNLIKISDKIIQDAIKLLEKNNTELNSAIPTKNNLAKQLAEKLENKIPIIISSSFLIGNAHIFSNQFNENGKTWSQYFTIPELNHHLLEGLSFPKKLKKQFHFIFLESDLYLPRVKKRFQITQKVLDKQKIDYSIFQLKEKTKLNQSFEMLILGSYVSFYLAILNKINPSKIPWVNYFKNELK